MQNDPPHRLYQPAPDVWYGMPVSADAFFALPRPPGWKYEGWDDVLHLEPDWQYEAARYVGPTPDGETPRGITIEEATGTDLDAFLDLADDAFRDSPDFFRCPDEIRRRQLRTAVEDAAVGEPDWIRRAQRVARARTGQLVALLLLREVDGGVALDTVGTHPAWRRHGLATTLLRDAMHALPVGVEVHSAWLVANRERGVWHRGSGFERLPTSVSEASRLLAARWACHAGHATRAEVDDVAAHVERLRETEADGRAPDPFTYTRPVHRRRPAVG